MSEYQNGKFNGIIIGFQKAQELSDKMFSLEDIKTFIDDAQTTDERNNLPTPEKLINSLSQPKQWNIESTHICNGIKINGSSCSKNNLCTYPNCGTIKITKIL